MCHLDTDTVTRAQEGHPSTAQRLRQLDPADVALSVITKIEILRGRYDFLLKARDGEQLLRAQQWLDRSEQLLRPYRIIPIDVAAAAIFDQLRQNKKLKKIGRADLLIASIALAHRATLVTRNLRHFQQVPGLRLENWAD